MAKYQEYVDYFENLCVSNLEMNHVVGDSKNKRFYRISLEELLSGTFKGFNQETENKPIFVFINYITDYKHKHQTVKAQQLMFWIICNFKKDNFDSEMTGRSKAEEVVESFLTRMRRDSENDHPLFLRSFDKIDNARTVPIDYKSATGYFVGLQVSISLEPVFSKCYEPSEWQADD